MGAITVDKADHLYWLGRYSERVYTTLKLYCDGYDSMLDADEEFYKALCVMLDIPNIYASREDFLQRYGYDRQDCNSIISNLTRAYDNAIVMRDEIGTETLGYIQMAVYCMDAAAASDAPVILLQKVVDHLLAFWGCVDDQIDGYCIRGIMKFGKRVERLDLYLRFHMDPHEVRRIYHRMVPRARESQLPVNKAAMEALEGYMSAPELDYDGALEALMGILHV